MANYKSRRILVVDDVEDMAFLLTKLLRSFDCTNVDTASDGAEALAKLATNDYDLVISDWNMFPMTGYELLTIVRSNDKTSKVPFIMSSAETRMRDVIVAKDAGVTDYLAKPYSAERLKEKVLRSLSFKPSEERIFGFH